MKKNHPGNDARKSSQPATRKTTRALPADLAAKIGGRAARLQAREPCTKYYARDVRPSGHEAKPT